MVADLVLPVLCLDRLVSENGLRLCCSTLAGGKTGTPYPHEQILDVRWTSKVNREGVSRKRVLRTWRENEKEFEKFPELIAKNPSFFLCGGGSAQQGENYTRVAQKKKSAGVYREMTKKPRRYRLEQRSVSRQRTSKTAILLSSKGPMHSEENRRE